MERTTETSSCGNSSGRDTGHLPGAQTPEEMVTLRTQGSSSNLIKHKSFKESILVYQLNDP